MLLSLKQMIRSMTLTMGSVRTGITVARFQDSGKEEDLKDSQNKIESGSARAGKKEEDDVGGTTKGGSEWPTKF
uniref:Uncharacterized protein n=1 Tax=Caenorhabditis japonica TaxID=281687 RepID=A0A8R1IJA8_CAEJA